MSFQHPVGVPPRHHDQHDLPGQPVRGRSGPPATWEALPPSWALPHPVPRALGTASVVLAALVAATQVAAFALSFSVVTTLEDAVAGLPVSLAVLSSYDGTTYAMFAAELAAGIVTIVWLWRSRTFAEHAAPGWPHARSRTWVWLGWMLPVVAFWFPYQVVRDVRAATLRGNRPGLAPWWAAWIVAAIASQLSGRALSSGEPDLWSALPVLDGIGATAFVAAAVLWARIVREVAAGQRAAVAAATQPSPGS